MIVDTSRPAPGSPGIEPRWTSSAKSGVGTSLTNISRVWFTLSHGIFNEIYYPRLDTACVRDMGLIITADDGFFSEEKRHCTHEVRYLEAAAPAYHLRNVCVQDRYELEKEIVADPRRSAIWQSTHFQARAEDIDAYRLYVMLAPHLKNKGTGNTGWIGDYKGVPMLFAARHGYALALASSADWRVRSAGYAGTSDGYRDLQENFRLREQYTSAADGNVALIGEIDLVGCAGAFNLVLAFGETTAEAGHHARAALNDGFVAAKSQYIDEWKGWLTDIGVATPQHAPPFVISATVMRVHEEKEFRGGTIASLAIPWGSGKGDDDLGGYHLVRPRDMGETAGGLLAVGAVEHARRILDYFRTTQNADGHWAQNMWLDGTPYWGGIQLDEAAFPIVVLDLVKRHGAMQPDEVHAFWPMVKRTLRFLVQTGPFTQQDRWEEDAGFTPFTLGVVIAALLIAADLADASGESKPAIYLRETADAWNASIEDWLYVTDTDLAKAVGVEGYYMRISTDTRADSRTPDQVYIRNRPAGDTVHLETEIVSPDAPALVRFGLRAADDPRIVNPVRVIDALLKTETPHGPVWHRYNDDGDGEHENGDPFDGTGIGRGWPLLTGERGHYELAAGRADVAQKMLDAMTAFANDGGLLPEQVWDSNDIPEKELFFGRPAGSAMPLVWAHAEYVKLARSIAEGAVFDLPPQTAHRYVEQKMESAYQIWRFEHQRRTISAGKTLRIEVNAPATVRWSVDRWQTVHETQTVDSGLAIFVADIANVTGNLVFTFHWQEADRWEGRNFDVTVVA